MRKTLMTTVAVVAVAGFIAIAAAQTMQSQSGGGAMSPQGAQQEHKSGTAGGDSTLHRQSGAQQNGAETENGIQQKGAQTPSDTQLKGAQGERNAPGAQSEGSKAGVNTQQNAQGGTSVQDGASHGASVQLSQEQRTRITTIIGKRSSARLTGKPDFHVTVGARVPRNVHVAVLPEDVVQIVPQYRGFDYVMVGDQILIIDPDTFEIVAVIPT
jgi:hypothetical protein